MINKKKKISIHEATAKEHINTFENADQKVKEYIALKEIVENNTSGKSGRPTAGKSKATNKIAFVVDDEMLDYLESLTTKQDRTPNAVAKKLFIRDYEIHHKG